MKCKFWILCAAVAACAGLSASTKAATTNLTLYSNVPTDESTPRTVADAPNVQFGPDSWQNTALANPAKVNAYVTPSALFGHSVTISDIASISYFTKTSAGQVNWFLNIYTDPELGGDASWYGQKFTNSDYGSYAADGAWHSNNVSLLTRTNSAGAAIGPDEGLAAWKASYGSKMIQYFSPQTSSINNDTDSQIDGLVVTLTNGDIGNVNFAAVPLPAAVWAGMGLMGALGFKGFRRQQVISSKL